MPILPPQWKKKHTHLLDGVEDEELPHRGGEGEEDDVPRAVGVARHEAPGLEALPRLEEAEPGEDEGADVDAQHHLELVDLWWWCVFLGGGGGGWCVWVCPSSCIYAHVYTYTHSSCCLINQAQSTNQSHQSISQPNHPTPLHLVSNKTDLELLEDLVLPLRGEGVAGQVHGQEQVPERRVRPGLPWLVGCFVCLG